MNTKTQDAQRYQRLRILGAAPGGSPNLDRGTVLLFQSLDDFVDADIAAHPSRGEAAQQQEPSIWTVTHNGKSVTADSLFKAMKAAQALRTDEEAQVAAENLLRAVGEELAQEPVAAQPQTVELSEDAQHFLAVAMLGFHGRKEASYDAARYALSEILKAQPMLDALRVAAQPQEASISMSQFATKDEYYEAMEREHLGDADKRTGIYAAPSAPLVSADAKDADRITALRDVVMDAAEEWAQYVEADSAPRTCREHIALAFDAALAKSGA